jgi:hypothetical protein
MSSYFDRLQSAVNEADRKSLQADGIDFLRSVWDIEAQLFSDVTEITGDREFPDDLRERILGVLATRAIYQPGRLPMPEKARAYVLRCRSSWAVEAVHSLFHELARRRIETRFGMLSDNPNHINALRDEHDREVRG